MQVRCVLGGAALLAVVAAHAHDARGDMLRRVKPLHAPSHASETHAPPTDTHTHAMYRAAGPAHAAHGAAHAAFAPPRDAPHGPPVPPRKHHLASGAVIGISIALGLGVAFLVGCVAVLGAVWTHTHTRPAPLTAASKRAQ